MKDQSAISGIYLWFNIHFNGWNRVKYPSLREIYISHESTGFCLRKPTYCAFLWWTSSWSRVDTRSSLKGLSAMRQFDNCMLYYIISFAIRKMYRCSAFTNNAVGWLSADSEIYKSFRFVISLRWCLSACRLWDHNARLQFSRKQKPYSCALRSLTCIVINDR